VNVSEGQPRSGWHVLRHRGFALIFAVQVLASMGRQIIAVAVGWQVYNLTSDPFDLGLVGLFQFAPAFLLVLVTGLTADRFNRRMIVAICLAGEGLCAAAILFFTWHGSISVGIIFGLLFLLGTFRAFMNPAAKSLIPNLVPERELSSAVALSSSSWELAVILGPALGGLLYVFGAEVAYGAALVFFAIAALCATLIAKPAQRRVPEPATWQSLSAGVRYIWTEKIVLGAITLDLFAVLVGGAVALFPVYARDILGIGSLGLGLMHSAMGVGALGTALYLTGRPIRDNVGIVMFVATAVFGLATLIFAVSTIAWLSMLMLVIMGAGDMISVYVRQTLVQLRTPDQLRGRVNSAATVVTGASNEIGGFRAGMVAALIGVVPAVAVGGLCTVAITALWAYKFPELRRVRHLDGGGSP
jgi:MFS family permease